MTNMYDVTVLIPVYNKEKYIANCINSLLKQTYDLNKIEILCINDGSTDKSSEIIKELQKSFANIILFEQQNSGVSAARNTGLKIAQGKYILFLDADDWISENTIKDVVAFFDEVQDRTDIITYPLYYYSNKNIKVSQRGQKLPNNALIDVSQMPDFSQTTMNVCVKRSNNILFNTRFSLCEDQMFNSQSIANKGTIGWCAKAKYYYNRDGSGTKLLNHPFFSYDSIVEFYQNLIALTKQAPNIGDYAKDLILYNFNWRIKGDYLYPYHLTDGKACITDKLLEVLNQIDNKLILSNQWLILDHKAFLMSLKTKNRPFVIFDDKCLVTYDAYNGELKRENSFTIVIQRERMTATKLKLMGFLKSFCINFINSKDITCYMNLEHNNGIRQCVQVPLYDSTNSYFNSKIKTNNYLGFDIDIKLNVKKISFIIKIYNHEYPTTFWFRNWNCITTQDKSNFHFSQCYSIENKDNKEILIHSSNSKDVLTQKSKYLEKLYSNSLGVKFMRTTSLLLKNKTIWLYSDVKNTVDNAFYQFMNDIKKHDGIRRFYVYKGGNKEVYANLIPIKYRKFLIKEGGLLHRLSILSCSKIFTSFFEHGNYLYYKKSFKNYSDLINPEVIYLQHGVMHGKFDNLYGKDKSFFVDKIVVSTLFEKNYAIKKLNFKPWEVIETGQPRYDYINKGESKNKILFAPSWRIYLVDHIGADHWQKNKFGKEFMESINSVLNNTTLHQLLEEYGLQMDVKLHRNFLTYSDDININSSNVHLVNSIVHSDYKLLITDISSFMYDFIYLNTPIIKFVPDWDKFKAGLHTFREFNSKYDEIGTFSTNEKELLSLIKIIVENGFKVNYDREKIMLPNLTNCCDALYNTLMTKRSVDHE